MADLLRKVRRLIQGSIFWKLFLIYLATTLVLVLLIGAFVRLVFTRDEVMKLSFGKNLVQYAGYLIEEIGDPPDRDRVAQLAEDLGLQFRIEKPEEQWASDPSLPPLSELTVRNSLPDPRSDRMAEVGRYRGHPFFILGRGETRFAVFFAHRPFREVSLAGSVTLLAVLALILAGSYLLARRMLRPINWLTEGAVQISKANFSHQVPIRAPDELGQLTTAFNEMAQRVRDMIRARERLLLDVSHELRSPLTRMKVALELVRDEATTCRLQDEIRELEAMIGELLESERLTSMHGGLTLAEVDLVALVREVAEDYSSAGAGVRVGSAPASVLLKLDRDRIRMALRNVIENAVKHSSPERGPVDVRIEQENSAVKVSVQDHGPGIPPDEQPLIFEPFYRVDKSRTRETGGYGLGLSMAKTIMTAHGGGIFLSSAPGQGSTFTLTFPILSGETHV